MHVANSPLPVCRTAVVSTDHAWRDDWVARLQRVESSVTEDQPLCTMEFLSFADADGLLQCAGSDGLLQCVVIDSDGCNDLASLLHDLRALRSGLDVFVALGEGEDSNEGRVEVFDRTDLREESLLRQLRRAIDRRARTPFADALSAYVEGARDAWHTPGHSSGDGLRDSPWVADFYRMMGEHIFNADLSVSVHELDSLLEPEHVIKEAQQLAARCFGARHTFFVTNGTSTANKVIVQHVLGNGGKMLLDQACHKSVHHAVVLFGVDPVYLPASANEHHGLYGPVSKRCIFDTIDANPDAELLVLTSCTYDGFYYDLEPIIRHAHGAGIKVLVDEAWYAHGYFHPALRPCALECGADYVTHSAHKMLAAFSQASMIHVADPDFDAVRFREHLNMHTSTSPQYAMIASLDVARKQMSMEGFARLSRCIGQAEQLRSGIARTTSFRVLELDDMLPDALRDDGVRLDPTKLTIDVSAASMSASRLQQSLHEDHAIQVEKITHNTLSILVTLGTTNSKVLRLLSALHKLDGMGDGTDERPMPILPALGDLCMRPREAFFSSTRLLPLTDGRHGVNGELVGHISSEQVVPYPPGIPVLVPGQRITETVLQFLLDLDQGEGASEIHGLTRRDGRRLLRVVDRAQASTSTASGRDAPLSYPGPRLCS